MNKQEKQLAKEQKELAKWRREQQKPKRKFYLLYLLVVQVICGLASGVLLGQKLGENVLLAPPMLEKLPAMFTWPQLFTALIGGAVALLMVPILRKALRK